jgi:hypothetical protein
MTEAQAGPWGDCLVGSPWVIKRDSEPQPVYEMWFVASSTRVACGEYHILRAVSSDPEGDAGWNLEPEEPVLRGEQAWETAGVAPGSVLYDAAAPYGEKYSMWYDGVSSTVQIGFATSEDGIDWKKRTQAVVTPEGREEQLQRPSVLRRGAGFEMWYSSWDGERSCIRYATSADGVSWNKWGPVLCPTQAWEQFIVGLPSVIFHDQPQILQEETSVYKLWYVGFPGPDSEDAYIGYAEAPRSDRFQRGDTNGDGAVDIADAIFTLGYLFAQGPEPTCLDAADANDDGAVDIADAIAVLSHLFAGAGPLPEPFGGCGPDPTADGVGCRSFPPCQ